MSSVGYPLIGDKLYGQASSLISRQALHAYQLTFVHPLTQEQICLTCPPPTDMLNIIESLKEPRN